MPLLQNRSHRSGGGSEAESRIARNASSLDFPWALAFALLLLPFLEPRGLNYLVSDSWGTVYAALRAVSGIAIMVLFLLKARRSWPTWLALGVAGVALLSTALNSGLSVSWVYGQWFLDWYPLAAGMMLVAIAGERRFGELLYGALAVTAILLVMNFVFVLIWPDGIYLESAADSFTLFGHKNMTIFLALASICCSMVLDSRSGKVCSLRTVALYLVSLVQCAICYSATSLVALILVAITFILVLSRKLRPLVNSAVVGAVYATVTLGVVVFRLQDIAAPIIQNVLGKTTTFTGRTYVWDLVMSMMDGPHLLLGYGTAPRFHLATSGFVYHHAHNDVLAALISGGAVALVLYLALVLWVIVLLFACRRSLSSAKMLVILVGFFTVGLMEPLYTICWGFVLGVAYFVGSSDDGASADLVTRKESPAG